MSVRGSDVFNALLALAWLAATSLAGAQELPPPTAADPAPAASPVSPTDPPDAGASAAPLAPREAPQALEVDEPAEANKRPATMDEVTQNSEQELHFGHVNARYSFNFFGEVQFLVQSPGGGALSPAFAIGAQDFVLRGELENHLVATTEFAIEFGEDNTPGVDLERLGVSWRTDRFFVDAGRTHTNIGYWNTAYHHGHWLQPSIERPRWVRFEDEAGLLPTHWIGLTAGANFDIGPGNLDMTVAIGNGRGKVEDDVRNTFDYQASKALYAMVEYTGWFGLHDLRVGLSGVYDRIAPQDASVRPALPDQAIQEFIGGFHVAYPSMPLLLIAEAYYIAHRALSHTWQTYGGFVLAGYNVGILTPYAELSEVLSSGGVDPFFIPDPSANAGGSVTALDVVLGLRVDLSAWSALKLEYAYTRIPTPAVTIRHAGTLNCSWGF